MRAKNALPYPPLGAHHMAADNNDLFVFGADGRVLRVHE
jgi:hypothetical protein